jgi:hypothetical protein
MSKFFLGAMVVYLIAMAAVVYGLRAARAAALRDYGSASAASEWQEWRREATKQSEGEGPVKRRSPKSEKPPALMLMTEHFNTCLALSLLLTSVLYGTLVAMVHGAYRRPEAWEPS